MKYTVVTQCILKTVSVNSRQRKYICIAQELLANQFVNVFVISMDSVFIRTKLCFTTWHNICQKENQSSQLAGKNLL